MSDLEQVVRASRGIVSRQQLADVDVGDPQIRRLVRRGVLRRLRPGWFATPHADPMIVEAVSVIELGYLPLRLSYRQIVHDWPVTDAAILTLVRRGDHRR